MWDALFLGIGSWWIESGGLPWSIVWVFKRDETDDCNSLTSNFYQEKAPLQDQRLVAHRTWSCVSSGLLHGRAGAVVSSSSLLLLCEWKCWLETWLVLRWEWLKTSKNQNWGSISMFFLPTWSNKNHGFWVTIWPHSASPGTFCIWSWWFSASWNWPPEGATTRRAPWCTCDPCASAASPRPFASFGWCPPSTPLGQNSRCCDVTVVCKAGEELNSMLRSFTSCLWAMLWSFLLLYLLLFLSTSAASGQPVSLLVAQLSGALIFAQGISESLTAGDFQGEEKARPSFQRLFGGAQTAELPVQDTKGGCPSKKAPDSMARGLY